jgi:uncharacterized RmlC-like cupin family protein
MTSRRCWPTSTGDSVRARTEANVISGELTVRYGDREETVGPGEAYYMPPGHVPAARAGSEFIQFSPAAQLRDVQAVMARTMAALPGA